MEYLKFVQYMLLNFNQDDLNTDCIENSTTSHSEPLPQKIISADESTLQVVMKTIPFHFYVFNWPQTLFPSSQHHFLETLFW